MARRLKLQDCFAKSHDFDFRLPVAAENAMLRQVRRRIGQTGLGEKATALAVVREFMEKVQSDRDRAQAALVRRGQAPELKSSSLNPRDAFYSQLARVVETKFPARGSAEQLAGLVSNPQNGVKAEELKWSGIIPWAQSQEQPLTKEAVLGYLRGEGAVRFEQYVGFGRTEEDRAYSERWQESLRRVQVKYNHFADPAFTVLLDGQELGKFATSLDAQRFRADKATELTGPEPARPTPERSIPTQYAQYQLPGGQNYREVVLAMPEKPSAPPKTYEAKQIGNAWAVVETGATDPVSENHIWRYSAESSGKNQKDKAKDKAKSMTEAAARQPAEPEYTSNHFPDVPNYVAHMRLNEREDADGKPGLFMEEAQSDRHQAGREKGYRENQQLPDTSGWMVRVDKDRDYFSDQRNVTVFNENGEFMLMRSGTRLSDEEILADAAKSWAESGNTGKIPDAPYRTTWPLQLFKRALADAVAAGKKWIGWTTGETQAERYDLSKQISSLEVRRDGSRYILNAYDINGNDAIQDRGVPRSELVDVVGKDLANKIISDFEINDAKREDLRVGMEAARRGMNTGTEADQEAAYIQFKALQKERDALPAPLEATYEGQDLKVGGEGMKGFYDVILPKEVGKYVKQWGAGVVKGEVYTDTAALEQAITLKAQRVYGKEVKDLTETEQKQIRFLIQQEEGDGAIAKTPIWRVDITPQMRAGVAAGQALFSSSLGGPKSYNKAFPDDKERRAKLLAAAEATFEEGIRTPEMLADELDSISPNLRVYSQKFWSLIVAFSDDEKVPLILSPDWQAVYDKKDGIEPVEPEKPAKKPDEQIADGAGGAKSSAADKLSQAVAAALAEGALDRRGLARLAKDSGLSDKEIDEAAEFGVYLAARKIVTDGESSGRKSREVIFDELVELYNRQPNLTSKTSESKVGQKYSTPVPMGYALGVAVDLNAPGETGYESTAGNGLLTVAASPGNIIVNELDPVRAENLKRAGFARVTSDDATQREAPSSGRQIMNPPFGTLLEGGEKREWVIYRGPDGEVTSPNIDQAIVLKSLEGLTENGKAGIIVGGKKGTDAERASRYGVFKTQLPFWNYLYQNYNVTDHFTVAGELYEKQGAGWPVDIIIVEGRGQSKLPLPYRQAPPMLRTWGEVKARLLTHETSTDTLPISSQPLAQSSPGGAAGGGGRTPSAQGGQTRPSGGGNGGPRGSTTGGQGHAGSGGSGAVGSNETAGAGPAGSSVSSPAADAAGELIEPAGPQIEDSDNALQLEYLPRSKAALLNAILVPRNLRDEIRQAFNDLEARRGAVDDFVLRELRWFGGNMDRMRAVLDGGQIDAVALAIDKIMLGTALVTGDQTGMGKGRVAAAVMAWAQLQGHIPIFVTDGDALYLPMMEDFRDIEAFHMVPYITNSSLTLKNDDGKVMHRSEAAARQREIARSITESGRLPGNANVVFTTYHQIGKDRPSGFSEDPKDRARRKKRRVPAPDGDRTAMLRALAGQAVFVMDEAHGAAGDSDVNYRLMQMLMGWNIENQAGAQKPVGAYYSSATFAKRPDNMPIYAMTDLGKAVDNPLKLPDIFAGGGVAMQQAASAMLARAGQYIRREMDYTGVTFSNEFIGEAASEENPMPEQYRQADAFTGPLRDIVDFSGEFQALVSELNALLMAEGEMIDGRVYADQLQGTDFADLIHNMVNQYMLAVKAKAVGQEAVALLAKGFKPVITVENTMEGPYEDTLAKGFEPNFQGLLHRYLVKATDVTRKKVSGQKVKEQINLPEYVRHPKAEIRTIARRLLDMFESIRDTIDQANVRDLHISPLDTIIEQIEAAGYTVGEITGRDTGVKTNGKRFTRPAGDKKAAGKNRILSMFNNAGKDGGRGYDALILNRSGSTGISAHAAPKFFDKRARKMLIAQPNADISVMMQMYGRIFRKGQLSLPEYIHVLSQIAGERRIAAVLSRKMKGLKANTTSNVKGSEMTEAADMFNSYGDMATYETLERHPEIVEQLVVSLNGQLPPRFDPDGNDLIAQGGLFFKKVSGETNILPARWQDVFYKEAEDEWRDIIAHETAMGTNLLIVENQDFKARVAAEEELVASVGETEFESAATLESLDTVSGRPPVPFAEVKAIMDSNAPAVQAATAVWAAAYDAGAEARMAELRRVNGHRETWAQIENNARERIQRDRAIVMDASMTFGQSVMIDVDGAPARGVVTDFKFDEKNPMLPSRQKAVIHVNTSKRVITVPASRLRRHGVFAPLASAEQHYDSSINTSARRYVVTGNLIAGWEALARQGAQGKIVTFTMADGAVRSGILLPLNYNPGDSMAKIATAAGLIDVLQRGISPKTSSGLFIRLQFGNRLEVRVPAARNRGGKYWRESAFTRLMDGGKMDQKGNEMVGYASMSAAAAIFEFITQINERLTYTKPRELRSSSLGGSGNMIVDAGRFKAALNAAAQAKRSPALNKEIVQVIAGDNYTDGRDVSALPPGHKVTWAMTDIVATPSVRDDDAWVEAGRILHQHGFANVNSSLGSEGYFLNTFGESLRSRAYDAALAGGAQTIAVRPTMGWLGTPVMPVLPDGGLLLESGQDALRSSPLRDASDAAYLAAVEAGDMETAQRMVDAAAKAAGYLVERFHGTNAKEFTVFKDWSHFGDEDQAQGFWGSLGSRGKPRILRFYIDARRSYRATDSEVNGGMLSRMLADKLITADEWRSMAAAAKQAGNEASKATGSQADYAQAHGAYMVKAVTRILQQNGFDSVVYQNEIEGDGDSHIPLSPNQIKSADPVTRDESGRVIPLSERFNPESDSILRATSFANLLRREGIDPDELDAMTEQARQETPGQRTIGRPDLALGMSDPNVMAVDELRDVEEQTIAEWDEAAREMLRRDYQGTAAMLMARGRTGDTLNPVETRAAQMIVARESRKKMTTAQQRRMQWLVYSYRQAGTEQARGLAARRDPFQSPADRHREFLMRMIFTPPPAVRRKLEAADLQEKERIMKEQEKELERIRLELARMGISLDDLFSGEVALVLKKSPLVAKLKASLDSKQQKALELLQTGAEYSDVAKGSGLSLAEAVALHNDMRAKFRASAIERMRAMREASKNSLRSSSMDDNIGVIVDAEALAAMSDSDAEAAMAKIADKLAEMAGLLPKEKQGKMKAVKRKPKRLFQPPGPRRADSQPELPNPRADVDPVWLTRPVPRTGPATQPRLEGTTPPAYEGGTPGGGLTKRGQLDLGDLDADETLTGTATAWGRQLFPGEPAWEGEMLVPVGADLGSMEDVMRAARAAQLARATGFDMLTEWWINNLLSGPATHVRNIVGNVSSLLLAKTLTRGVEVLLRGQPAEMVHLWKGLVPGIQRGWYLAKMAWAHETDFFRTNVLDAEVEFDGLVKGEGRGPAIPGKVGRGVRIPGRFLAFVDALFKGIIGQMEAGAQAYRIGKAAGLKGKALTQRMRDEIQRPNSQAWQLAVQKAEETTFQQRLKKMSQQTEDLTAVGMVAAGLEHGAAAVSEWANSFKLLKWVLPFIRTPYNILRTGIRISPAGGILLANELVSGGFARIRHGKPMTKTHPLMVQHAAEQIIAWSMALLLAGAVEGGDDDEDQWLLITGTRKRGAAGDQQARTYPATSIRIFGQWFNYGSIEPVATALGIYADAVRTHNGGSDGSLVASVRGQIDGKTFLKGLSDLWDGIDRMTPKMDADGTIREPEMNMTDALLKSAMTALVPNLIRQTVAASDDTVRDWKSKEWWHDAFPSGAGASPQIDVMTGEPVKRPGNMLTRLLFPFLSKPPEQIAAADQMLMKWNQQNPDKRWLPDDASRTLFMRGPDGKLSRKVELSPQAYEYLQRRSAVVAQKLMPQATDKVDEPVFRRIREAFKEGRDRAREELRRWPLEKLAK